VVSRELQEAYNTGLDALTRAGRVVESRAGQRAGKRSGSPLQDARAGRSIRFTTGTSPRGDRPSPRDPAAWSAPCAPMSHAETGTPRRSRLSADPVGHRDPGQRWPLGTARSKLWCREGPAGARARSPHPVVGVDVESRPTACLSWPPRRHRNQRDPRKVVDRSPNPVTCAATPRGPPTGTVQPGVEDQADALEAVATHPSPDRPHSRPRRRCAATCYKATTALGAAASRGRGGDAERRRYACPRWCPQTWPQPVAG
jgi:hypothetical protein